MQASTLLYILLAIITINYIFETILELLNLSYRNKEIPKILDDIYDHERYKKAMNYEKESSIFSIVKSTFFYILTLCAFLFGAFALLHDISMTLSNNPIIISLTFFGLLFFVWYLISLPFSYFHTFVIEEKYGFNKSTLKTFITDKIKSFFLSILIGGLLLFVLIWLFLKFERNFWIMAWLFITFFSLIMTMFYSDIIVPLFNKQVPLDDDELYSKIMDFARKTNFEVDKIYKLDGSKRTTKANAYFSGLGKRKRIVLYDTLINTMTHNEIVAVLAHEIGHYKHKHIIKSFVINTLHTSILLYVFSLVSQSQLLSEALLYSPFGYNSIAQPQAYFHLNITVFTLLYSPVSTFIELILNAFYRKNEYEADNFAKKYGLAPYLVKALKKLASNNMSNLTPHPLYVKIYYSHPDLKSRIENLLNVK